MNRSNYIKYLWLLLLAIPAAVVFVLLKEEAFRFQHKMYLWGLAALVPMTVLFLFFQNWRNKNLKRFANSSLLEQLTPDISFNKHLIKFILLSLAFELIVIGFANPQVGTKQEKVKREGIDVIIAMDVSNSMLSEDIKPNPSFDEDFAETVVLDTLAVFINDATNYVVEYMDRPLSVTSKPHVFKYTDTGGIIRRLRINPVADERLRKMNITVPVPATQGHSVLEGYGQEVIGDLAALSSSSLADAQKYLLATAMFRRCR